MNTKFSFILIVTVIVLLAAACTPAKTSGSAPVRSSDAIIPVTGEKAAETGHTEAEDVRLWSGEIFMSDGSAPDYESDAPVNAPQDAQSECIPEDSQPRRNGGCVE
jgi:hypothetical protein